ncbi:unnamed protein product [Blepharisma stoltei]|uniref:Uncharacterized protein n=1 Tax=Blepharisma stoltei TaxID=1481888 RepID=A0AAU9ILN8_9CILI|nr:unnamed protein product [Blepharisma stoltei]
MDLILKRSSTDHHSLSLNIENIITQLNKISKRCWNFEKKGVNINFEDPMKNSPNALLIYKFNRRFPITKEHINLSLAKKIIANLSNLTDFGAIKESYLNKVDFKPISNYIKDYLTEGSKEVLYNIILLSKTTDSLNLASSNAITILNKAGFIFTNKDLSMIKIPNAELSYGIFYNTNFSSSNLHKVNFSRAYISGSNFKGCDMTEVNFREKVTDIKTTTEIFKFSNCGRFLAIVSNKITWLYNLKKNQEITQLVGHNKEITFLTFSDDGKYLGSWSSDSVAILWDTYQKSKIRVINGCRNFMNFSPCGTYLSFIFCVTQGCISIYDINLDQVINKIRYGNFIPKFTLFSHTGTHLIALYHYSCIMSKWNLWGNGSEERIKCQNIETCFAISSCRKYVAVPYTYCRIHVYNLDKFEFVAKLDIKPYPTYLAFSPCGRFLASGAEDKYIEVLDLSSSKGNTFNIFNKKNLKMKPFVFSSDGNYLFVVTADQRLKSWEISPNFEANAKQNMTAIKTVSFSFDSEYFAASNEEGWIFIFFTKNQKLFKEFKAHNHWISRVFWSWNIMATSSIDNYIKIWDIYTCSPLQIIQANKNIDISPDGKKILSCSRLNLINIFDIEKGQMISQWKANRQQVHMWIWSQCGKFVIVCSADRSISIWKADNQELIAEFIKHNHEVTLISLSTCGNFLISSSLDKNIKVWYLGNIDQNFQGACVIKDFRMENLTTSIKWNYDGTKCLWGDSQGTIAIWDRCTGKFISFNAHIDSVTSIDSSRCGNFLITGSNDRTVKLWRLDIK